MTKWFSLLQRKAGRSRKECDKDSFSGKPNVNREYLKAFRTKSYVEICNKAQEQKSDSSMSSPLTSFMHLTECLLEPRQEIVTNMTRSMKMHHLLVDYFEATLEACRCCDTILEGVRQTRLASDRITTIVKQSKRVQFDGNQCIYTKLASFVLQDNPLSSVSFGDIHERYMLLLQRLNSKRGKTQRRLIIKRVCKKVGKTGLVILQSALVVASLVVAFHSIIGIVVAPCIMGSFFGFMRKRFKWVHKRQRSRNTSEGLYQQLDVAAKGVFILINDLDTMSRVVKRLDDEVEHWREVADICVKNGTSCRGEILEHVVREFHDHESSFVDMLEELEEHVYLCFLTINRSRRLVMEAITEEQH
ncbi:UPF0496 protein At1g20180-like [Lotus japonicus]|uniref:UPF0496 protein At1g20180-like n=1 Tax=Lotus japonicus TaxID=34305 RepID=UPI0025896C9E|nr:UPF0496 protein At1g20180-like [Lotus japonicus]